MMCQLHSSQRVVLFLAALVMFQFVEPRAGAAEDWARNFRVGMSLGINLHAQFEMGGDFAVSGSQAGEFSDGYVRMDETGNAGGYTSNWGYDSASQYDAGTRTLSFHRPESFSTPGGTGEGEDAPYIGFDMAYGMKMIRWQKASLDLELGFQLMPINIQDGRTFSATITNSGFSFQVPDNVVIPTAPYDGSPSGIGPSIFATNAIAGAAIGSPGTISGTRELDATLYNIRLGPSLHWELHRYVALAVSAGVSLGIVSGDYNFNEIVNLPDGSQFPNTGGFSSTDFVYGGYAGAVVLVHVQEDADLFVGAHFVSLTEYSLEQRGRGVSLDLSQGAFFSAGISWPF